MSVYFIRYLKKPLLNLIVINSQTNIVFSINITDMTAEFNKTNNTDKPFIAYYTNLMVSLYHVQL